MTELRLMEERPVPGVFNAGISIDNLSWWFWIKAGAGFTVGVAMAGAVIGVAWTLLVLTPLLSWYAGRVVGTLR